MMEVAGAGIEAIYSKVFRNCLLHQHVSKPTLRLASGLEKSTLDLLVSDSHGSVGDVELCNPLGSVNQETNEFPTCRFRRSKRGLYKC